MRGDSSASRIVTSAPMRRPTPGSWRIFRSSDKRPRLKRAAGAINRFFNMITRAVPPDMTLVSSFCAASRVTASSSVPGCKSLTLGMCVVRFVLALFALSLLFQRAQDLFRGNRQIQKVMTDGPTDSIADSRAHRRYGGLADAVHFRDAVGFEQMNRHRGRNILERRNHVIGEIGIGNAAVGILNEILKQHLSHTDDRCALDLQLAQAWIDHFAGIEFTVELGDLDLSGLGVYLDFTGNHCRMPFCRAVSLAGFKIHHYGAAIGPGARDKCAVTQK